MDNPIKQRQKELEHKLANLPSREQQPKQQPTAPLPPSGNDFSNRSHSNLYEENLPYKGLIATGVLLIIVGLLLAPFIHPIFNTVILVVGILELGTGIFFRLYED